MQLYVFVYQLTQKYFLKSAVSSSAPVIALTGIRRKEEMANIQTHRKTRDKWIACWEKQHLGNSMSLLWTVEQAGFLYTDKQEGRVPAY